jgi:hypothetical protein
MSSRGKRTAQRDSTGPATREIAADEARHAALSHRVHARALAQLDAPARERVIVAPRAAMREPRLLATASAVS